MMNSQQGGAQFRIPGVWFQPGAAAHNGHHTIDDAKVEQRSGFASFGQLLQCALTVGGLRHLHPGSFKHAAKNIQVVALVVNNQCGSARKRQGQIAPGMRGVGLATPCSKVEDAAHARLTFSPDIAALGFYSLPLNRAQIEASFVALGVRCYKSSASHRVQFLGFMKTVRTEALFDEQLVCDP
jgi:hypothetical protein